MSTILSKPFFKSLTLAFIILLTGTQCDELEIAPEDESKGGSSSARLPIRATPGGDCNQCDYIVPAKTHFIDGEKLGLGPGSVIGLDATIDYDNPLLFTNLKGTANQPIAIINCGGRARIKAEGKSYVIKTQQCEYFRISGGSDSRSKGIFLTGASLGLTLDYLSTNFEIDNIEVANVGFAGIMAKTDPSCDELTMRNTFTMKEISIHHNYIHDTGGEGFYVGNSFFNGGVKLPCGTIFPHAIEDVKIFNNVVKNSGWEGIQLGAATKNAEVYNNHVENFGMAEIHNQRNGIQIGEGTGGKCYNNFIKSGNGNGIVVLGLGDNLVFNNIIVDPGTNGIFCDERFTPGSGFTFVNNTIINPGRDGIRIYADLVDRNVIMNNIIVNPGSYNSYPYPRNGSDSYIYKLNQHVNVDLSNNYFTRNIDAVQFVNPAKDNYRLLPSSHIINKGRDVAAMFDIQIDHYNKPRKQGTTCDIGASEY